MSAGRGKVHADCRKPTRTHNMQILIRTSKGSHTWLDPPAPQADDKRTSSDLTATVTATQIDDAQLSPSSSPSSSPSRRVMYSRTARPSGLIATPAERRWHDSLRAGAGPRRVRRGGPGRRPAGPGRQGQPAHPAGPCPPRPDRAGTRRIPRGHRRVRPAARVAAVSRVQVRSAEAPARDQVRTHRQLRAVAQRAGNPRVVRAVGTACATNPLPVIVSCHQVVRSGGGVGGYLGGTDAKRSSLTLEAAAETRSPVWTATRSRTSSRRLTQLHGRAFIRPGLLVE